MVESLSELLSRAAGESGSASSSRATQELVIDATSRSDADGIAAGLSAAAGIGGKAAGLLELQTRGLTVPPFYVITTQAFLHALQANDAQQLIQTIRHLENESAWDLGLASELRETIRTLQLPELLVQAVRYAHEHAFDENVAVAVRSSATDEDGGECSFAGMHDSVLGVSGVEAVLEALRRVWASLFSDRAFAYRQHQMHRTGPRPLPQMAVVVQRMVPARASGVVFTCDPATHDPHQMTISCLPGLGEGLVSGGLPADTYVVSKSTRNVQSEIQRKSERFVMSDDAAGTQVVALQASRGARSTLSSHQVQQVVELGLTVEQMFGRPQDLEFCFDEAGQLHILQTRPVTGVPEYGPAAGNHLIWDNSNIIESYSGVTTPMTFSFIRRAYTIVYYCFAEVMGIPRSTVQTHRETFENMLGLFRGRVYYNLRNWYRLVRMFPGYRYNSEFMESMMGLKEPLLLEDETQSPGFWRRWFVELPALVRLVVRTSWHFFRIRRRVADFERHFQKHYADACGQRFRSMPPHEVLQWYRRLEDALLWNWKAPIINDFYVMVFYGILRKLCTAWCGDSTGTLQNGLLSGDGALESAEPAAHILRLARLASAQPPLRECILHAPLEQLPHLIAAEPEFQQFQQLFDEYLEKYGLRCVDELKLEQPSFRERPQELYRLIRGYVSYSDSAAFDEEAIRHRQRQVRSRAEQTAQSTLSAGPRRWLRRPVFWRVLHSARLGVRNRENMRFARTRIYGVLREMLRSIAAHLVREDLLDNEEDVFYLTLDELRDFVRGTSVSTDLKGLVQVRRGEFDDYRNAEPPPADRFETYGMPYHRNQFQQRSATVGDDGKRNSGDGADGNVLCGQGCCPGRVRGPVRLVRDAAECAESSGGILATQRTDPGWVPFYPAFSGLLIERGSVLSHSAIVAREMGLPTIVGLSGLTQRLHDGQHVTMDGAAGTVQWSAATAAQQEA